jgi:micrococcal nuclease
VPTLDPNAIQTAIAETFSAQERLNTPTNTSLPTGTPLPAETLPAVETATPLSTPLIILQTGIGASCIPDHPPQTGKIVDVVDGDTIKVLMDDDGQTYTVRYIGMDTPESTSQVEYFGAEAASKNVQLVFGKNLTLVRDVSETDRYGRLLRYVIVDGLFINYELVAQGYANTASFPPDITCIPTFLEAEGQARASKLGLWIAPPTLAVVPTSAPSGGGSGGGTAVCNCGGPDLDCGDFSTHASAQACHNYCVSQGLGDIFRLDGNDNDGLACESLP